MRQIALDTETTGLSPAMGHRVIEIGCIELNNRRITQNHFHHYLQPDREIEKEAIKVHGITNAFLQGKPRFTDVVDDFLAFISGAELIIHNASFDLGFLNHELNLLGGKYAKIKIESICGVIDSLTVARQKHPGQKNSLDAICKRYNVDLSVRGLHGALLDSTLLAKVYVAMTQSQSRLSLEIDQKTSSSHIEAGHAQAAYADMVCIMADETELARHQDFAKKKLKAEGFL